MALFQDLVQSYTDNIELPWLSGRTYGSAALDTSYGRGYSSMRDSRDYFSSVTSTQLPVTTTWQDEIICDPKSAEDHLSMLCESQNYSGILSSLAWPTSDYLAMEDEESESASGESCFSPSAEEPTSWSQDDALSEIEADAVLYLEPSNQLGAVSNSEPERVACDGVLYLTEERQFVSVDSPLETPAPFDLTELYFAPELQTSTPSPAFSNNDNSINNFNANANNAGQFASASDILSELYFQPSGLEKIQTPTFIPSTPPSPVQPPCTPKLLEGISFNGPKKPAAGEANRTLTSEIQMVVWGNQVTRNQYFDGELRRCQLLRYREKKLRRFQYKRPVDAARSRVAKQRMRNSKGRFVQRGKMVN